MQCIDQDYLLPEMLECPGCAVMKIYALGLLMKVGLSRAVGKQAGRINE